MWECDTRGSQPTFNICFLLTMTPSFPSGSLRLRSHLQPADDWHVALLLVNASNDSVTFSLIMNIISIIRRQGDHVRHLGFKLLFDQSKPLHVMCCHGNWRDLDGYTYMAYTKKAIFLISNSGPLRGYWSETQGCVFFLDACFRAAVALHAAAFNGRAVFWCETIWQKKDLVRVRPLWIKSFLFSGYFSLFGAGQASPLTCWVERRTAQIWLAEFKLCERICDTCSRSVAVSQFRVCILRRTRPLRSSKATPW